MMQYLRFVFLALLLSIAGPSLATRVKDLGQFEGVRSNSLIGYGLMVGLDGTGDQTTQTPFTSQSMTAMLSQMGIVLPPGSSMQTKNIAAVMITAELPAFGRPGDAIDVTVSSLGNSKSLRGGTLLMTPLKGPDGEVYALAQGNIALSGATGRVAQQQNAGRIPQGAKIEKMAPLPAGKEVALILFVADYSTAQKVESAINAQVGNIAKAVDARRIVFSIPGNAGLPLVELAAKVEVVNVDVPAMAARVVINARTGSIVMGANVEVGECAISHGSLTFTVGSKEADKPASTSQVAHVKAQATLADVVKSLGALGVSPADLIAILQAMRSAGALQAEIEVI
jgi:flagellar P-ring protein precursor FlgI